MYSAYASCGFSRALVKVRPVSDTIYVQSAGLLRSRPTLWMWGKSSSFNGFSGTIFHSKQPHDFSLSFWQQKNRRPWFSPCFLTFLTQQFNACSHFGLGSWNLSAHYQKLHGVWRSQKTKNGLPKLRLFTSRLSRLSSWPAFGECHTADGSRCLSSTSS